MTKYQKIFSEMIENNQSLFSDFQQIHDKYAKDSKAHQDQFNAEGKKVMDVIRDYENRLCGTQERGGYGMYSSNLSEKFWEVIRKQYPLIDFVGAKVS